MLFHFTLIILIEIWNGKPPSFKVQMLMQIFFYLNTERFVANVKIQPDVTFPLKYKLCLRESPQARIFEIFNLWEFVYRCLEEFHVDIRRATKELSRSQDALQVNPTLLHCTETSIIVMARENSISSPVQMANLHRKE